MLSLFQRVGDFISGIGAIKRLGTAFVIGIVSALAFAPYPGFPFFLLSISFCLLLVETAQGWKQAFWTGLFFGFGQFGLGVHWIGYSFLAQAEVPAWLAPIAVILLVGYLSLFMASAFAIAKILFPARWAKKALVFAVSFSAFEFLRGVIFTGFPWNPAAAIWWPLDFMFQPAALVGAYGLGFLTVLAGGLLTPLFIPAASSKKHFVPVLMAVALLVTLTSFGLIRLAGSEVQNFEGVRLRLVQANIPQAEKWNDKYLERNLERYVRLSTQVSEKPVTHVIWSESSIPYDIYNDRRFQSYLAQRLGNDKILVSGANRITSTTDVKVFNSIFALSPQGRITAIYDKSHLVPFGEFIPFRSLLGKLGLDTLTPGSFNFSKGPGLKTLLVADTPSFGPLVCYEIIFPGTVTEPDNRPAWLLNLTNDAWFGTSSGPYQHFALARLRAVEEGLAIVRVAGTGISGVIDPYGRIIDKIDLQTQGILDIALPKPLTSQPLFSIFGNLTFFGLLTIGIGGIMLRKFKIAKKGGLIK